MLPIYIGILTAPPPTAAVRRWDKLVFLEPNGDGVSGPYGAWSNGALDNAFFGGAAAGTVNLGVPVTVHNDLDRERRADQAGAGALTLTGTNTFNGGLNITARTLSVSGDASLGAASKGIALSAGTTLRSNRLPGKYCARHKITPQQRLE
ncbi:autotransporter-associated beta strand repeat-containing protein [Phyllobacterium endophyticum]|uniref:Uncharacterized protein n=1 Tax=Phyllobacterium endophyticum TaxID=1149773 RepID=A0A2P7ARH0_9HYPH|nr:autotransporter-associated beta strand repeat-containing protein [Phyllobacterium endophyticum]MBB3237506.1 autotransporter-associated beta strand protein [Phyllobacterium endophyticum]PSH56824.1 hypothetical protein CU100_15965 [Phyllobacterium endophyticum]TYR44192.1 hypothetical protein FY050_03285 [Phyllobacterium endophyticum]